MPPRAFHNNASEPKVKPTLVSSRGEASPPAALMLLLYGYGTGFAVFVAVTGNFTFTVADTVTVTATVAVSGTDTNIITVQHERKHTRPLQRNDKVIVSTTGDSA